MRLDLSQRLRMEQTLRLAPQMIQAIEILQIPVLELQDRIEQELEVNPVLEVEESTVATDGPVAGAEAEHSEGVSAESAVPSSSESADGAAETAAAPESEEGADKFDFLEETWNEELDRPRINRAAGEEAASRKLEAMQNRPARAETLQEHLVEQLHMADMPDAVRLFAEYIVYNMDENGYLLFPLEEIATSYDPKGVTPETAAEALRVVQSLDPPGVGARNLQECLLLQLDRKGGEFRIEKLLITNHLEDIQNNRLPKIAKDTGADLAEVKEGIQSIRELNPRPGTAFGAPPPQYIVPDVVVSYVDGRYEVRLENAYIPSLRLNPMYLRQLAESKRGSQEAEFLKRKAESARWLIEAIHQRQSTLQRIANEVFRIQQDFLDKGPNFLHPLRMQEVADNVGVHISTVSRAISGKYAQTPRGIFPLRQFFTGAAKSTDGAVESQEGVRQKLLEIVNKEDKRFPLSDEDIVAKFKEAGIEIARRTVTKYRKALRIPSSRQRRAY